MTVDEQRAIREALAPIGGDWQFKLAGLKLVCPACLANEWLEGATVALCHQRTHTPQGQQAFHFACPDCGLMTFGDFLAYDLGRWVPENAHSWN